MIRQRTLKNTIRATGIGLHGGRKVYLTLVPAPIDTGIVFRRVDSNPPVVIRGTALNVHDTELATTIGEDGVRVSTVEHLMAALAGLGIDNCFVDLSADEVPIMDGSAAPFVFLVQSAGILEQGAPKRFIRVRKPVEVRDGEKFARFEPFRRLQGQVHDRLRPSRLQRRRADLRGRLLDDVVRARDQPRPHVRLHARHRGAQEARPRARRQQLDNAIVIDEYRILNEDGLRYRDEFVRHKILDAIGDLYLLGHSLIGSFTGYKSGHALNNRLLRALLANESAMEEVVFEDVETAPISYLQPQEAAG